MGCMLRTWTGGVVNWHLQTRSSRWAIAMRGSRGSEGLCSGLEPIILRLLFEGERLAGDGPGREKTDRARLCRAGAGSGSSPSLESLDSLESGPKGGGRSTNVGSKKWRESSSHTKILEIIHPKTICSVCLNQV